MAGTEAPPSHIIIKKYGNRRLYDTQARKYITLEGLSRVIKKGSTVQVVEASTDRDLTRQVLTQVILEQHEALDMIPVELLHAIIRLRGSLEQAPFSAFLTAIARQFIDGGQLWTQQVTSMLAGFGPSDATENEPAESEPKEESQPAQRKGKRKNRPVRTRIDALIGRLESD